MQCPKCQFENVDGAKFCNECGYKLEISCPGCSKINPPGSPKKRCKEAHRIKSRLKESANLMSPGYFVSTWFPFVSTRTFLFLLFVCCVLLWPHFKTSTPRSGFEPQYLDVYKQTVGGFASGPPKG